jgi:hypothetical protein
MSGLRGSGDASQGGTSNPYGSSTQPASYVVCMNGQYYMVPFMQGQDGPIRTLPGMAQGMGYPGGAQMTHQGQVQYMSGMSGPSGQIPSPKMKK